MEGYFASLPEMIQGEEKFGWESFVKESYAFKHARLDVERRVADGGTVKTADIARLMELFQVRRASRLYHFTADLHPLTVCTAQVLVLHTDDGNGSQGSRGSSTRREGDGQEGG